MPCKYCGQPSPEEFYKNAMDLNEGKLFSIFGRTAEQILRALHFYDMRSLPEYEPMEKSKMTRHQAIIKVQEMDGSFKGVNAEQVVLALEALGLLKFEERPSPLSIFGMMFDSISADRPSTKAKELSNWLDRMGYKIVDK